MIYSIENIKNLDKNYWYKLLEWRNKEHVRDMMIDKSIISEKSHYKYINKIKNNEDYDIYIGFMDNKPFGVMNIWKIEKCSYEFGYYLINNQDVNSGLGIIMEYFSIDKIFSIDKNISIYTNTYNYNKKTISLHKRFGFEYLSEENNLVKQVLTYDIWENKKSSIEKLIKFMYK